MPMPRITLEDIQKLEDAVLIAWCLTVGIHQRDAREEDVDAMWLERKNGTWLLIQMEWACQPITRFVLNEGIEPILTEEVRVTIREAMKATP